MPLRILHLEDSRLDARLVEVHLLAAFPDAELVVAGDKATYEEALRRPSWDVILSDYVVPGFSGLEALHLARERHPDVPFIVVTGAIGEEAAVETLRAGASDFLLKSRLKRLAPVIHRAIEENWKALERQAALEALGQRAISYRALANNMPHFVARLDQGLRFVFANRVWQEALGRGEEEILGKTFADLGLEPSLFEPFEAVLRRAFQEKDTVDAILVGPMEASQRMELRVVPEPDAVGGVPTVLAVGRDTTLEQRALDELQIREETYRATFENSLVVAWLVDPTNGTIVEANAASAAFYGYSREAFRGLPLAALATLDEAGRKANMDRLLRGESLHFETRHRLKNGELRDVEIFTSPLENLDKPMAYAICHDITARKEAEARVKEAQRMAHMGDWIMDLGTRKMTVSDNLCLLAGFEPGGFPTDVEDAFALIHPEDREGFKAQIGALEEGREARAEAVLRVFGPDGTMRHHQFYAELVRDGEGCPAFIRGSNLDVSERMKAELDRDTHFLRLANLRLALDEAAIWAVTDRHGAITHANQLFLTVSGYSMEELQGQNHRILKSGMHPDAFYADMWHTIAQGHIWKGIICNKAKDGHLYWVDSTIVPFLDGQGRPVEYLSIRFEITAQKAAEANLAQVAEERKVLLEATSVAKAVPFSEQADGSLLFGPTALGVLGLPPELCPKTPAALQSLVDPEYVGDLQEALGSGARGRTRIFEAPFHPGHGQLWTRWTLAREGGRLRGVIQDITEAHLYQEQLLQSQKLESLGTLVGGIAHDFNNLLMAILGYVDVLRETSPEPKDLERALDTIHRAASRGRTLVAELMNFGRRHAPTRTPTDLNLLLEEVSHLLVRALPSAIELRLQPEPGLPLVPADSSQIHQVVMNLALNARDAFSGGGLITLRTGRSEVSEAEAEALGKRSGPHLFIEVEDTGSGMAPEVVTHIFEPFFTTKPVGKGTGLGLSVAYGIVESHGGLLRCHSEVGKGTRISILLPLALDPGDGDPGSTPRAAIAVLDAPSPDREALLHLLTELGHAPSAFEAADPLLAAHRTQPFQLLIVRPDTLGDDPFLLTRLQADGLDCPTILAMANPTRPRPNSTSALLLSHPFRANELIEALGRLLP